MEKGGLFVGKRKPSPHSVFYPAKGTFFPLFCFGVMRILFRWKKGAFLWVKKKPSPHSVFYPSKRDFFPFSVLGVMRILFRWGKRWPFCG